VPTNEEKLEALGWLDDDGCCCFPDDVLGVVLGYKAPAIPIQAFAKMTPEQLQNVVDMGRIKFADANADYYTFNAFVRAYPDLPDPIFQLEMRGKWPPSEKGVVLIGRR
jgi:hypothetical protein